MFFNTQGLTFLRAGSDLTAVAPGAGLSGLGNMVDRLRTFQPVPWHSGNTLPGWDGLYTHAYHYEVGARFCF